MQVADGGSTPPYVQLCVTIIDPAVEKEFATFLAIDGCLGRYANARPFRESVVRIAECAARIAKVGQMFADDLGRLMGAKDQPKLHTSRGEVCVKRSDFRSVSVRDRTIRQCEDEGYELRAWSGRAA